MNAEHLRLVNPDVTVGELLRIQAEHERLVAAVDELLVTLAGTTSAEVDVALARTKVAMENLRAARGCA